MKTTGRSGNETSEAERKIVSALLWFLQDKLLCLCVVASFINVPHFGNRVDENRAE